jgi:hypothetical protein
MVHHCLLISIYNNHCRVLKACMLKLLLVFYKKEAKSIKICFQTNFRQHMGRNCNI